jgi:hypothetical protein
VPKALEKVWNSNVYSYLWRKEMKDSLGIYFLIFCGALVVGTWLPQGFFKPWYEDSKFYGGELVKYSPEAKNADFYNFCDQGKVIYVYNQNNILVEWSKCDRMDFPQYRNGFLDLHVATNLVKK